LQSQEVKGVIPTAVTRHLAGSVPRLGWIEDESNFDARFREVYLFSGVFSCTRITPPFYQG
jgi:hypothetical protein